MIKERLIKIAEYQGVSILNFEKICGLNRGNISNMGENSEIGSEKLSKISETFPEINSEWLLTGKGNMLKNENENAQTSSQNVVLNAGSRNKDNTILLGNQTKNDFSSFKEVVTQKNEQIEKIISQKDEQIEKIITQKDEQLKEKDCQIREKDEQIRRMQEQMGKLIDVINNISNK